MPGQTEVNTGFTFSTRDNYAQEQSWLNLILDRTEMTMTENNDKACDMVVTLSNNGLKEFAVAFPKGSTLRWELP